MFFKGEFNNAEQNDTVPKIDFSLTEISTDGIKFSPRIVTLDQHVNAF